jgi:hypothetical protein
VIGGKFAIMFLEQLESDADKTFEFTVGTPAATLQYKYDNDSSTPVTGNRVFTFMFVSDEYNDVIEGHPEYERLAPKVINGDYVVYNIGQKTDSKNPADKGVNYVKALREVVNPKVTQLSQNRYLMTFWSNFYGTYDVSDPAKGYSDSSANLAYMNEITGSGVSPINESDVYKAMFATIITFTTVKFQTGDQVRLLYYPLCSKPKFIYRDKKNVYGVTPGTGETTATGTVSDISVGQLLVKNESGRLLCWGEALQADTTEGTGNYAYNEANKAFAHYLVKNTDVKDAPQSDKLAIIMLEDVSLNQMGRCSKSAANVVLTHQLDTGSLQQLTAGESWESLIVAPGGCGYTGFSVLRSVSGLTSSLYCDAKTWRSRFTMTTGNHVSAAFRGTDQMMWLIHRNSQSPNAYFSERNYVAGSGLMWSTADYMWYGAFHEFDARVQFTLTKGLLQLGQGFFVAVYSGSAVANPNTHALDHLEVPSTQEDPLVEVQVTSTATSKIVITAQINGNSIAVSEPDFKLSLTGVQGGNQQSAKELDLFGADAYSEKPLTFRVFRGSGTSFTDPTGDGKIQAAAKDFTLSYGAGKDVFASPGDIAQSLVSFTLTEDKIDSAYVAFGLLNMPPHYIEMTTVLNDPTVDLPDQGTLSWDEAQNGGAPKHGEPSSLEYTLKTSWTECSVVTDFASDELTPGLFYVATDQPAWVEQGSAPTDPTSGMLWWNTGSKTGFIYSGAWVATSLPYRYMFKVIRYDGTTYTLVSYQTVSSSLSFMILAQVKQGSLGDEVIVTVTRTPGSAKTRFYLDITDDKLKKVRQSTYYRYPEASGSPPTPPDLHDTLKVSGLNNALNESMSVTGHSVKTRAGESQRTLALVEPTNTRTYRFKNTGTTTITKFTLMKPADCSGWSANDGCFALTKNDVVCNLYAFLNVGNDVTASSFGECVNLAGDVRQLSSTTSLSAGTSLGADSTGKLLSNYVGFRVVAYSAKKQLAFVVRDIMPSQLLRLKTTYANTVTANTIVDVTGAMSGTDITGQRIEY